MNHSPNFPPGVQNAGGFEWGPRPAPPSTGAPGAVLGVLGIGLVCVLAGISVAVADINAAYLSAAVIGCLLVLYDFRIGVVGLIVLFPISASQISPHEIFGLTGLNPLNLLLAGTLASCLMSMSTDRRLLHVVPAPLLWLYIVPFVAAGILGSRHVGEIFVDFFRLHQVNFYDEVGYLRDLVMKPLFLVLFAVLVGAAAMRSQRPERFIYPLLASVWVMCLLAILYFAFSDTSIDKLSGEFQRDFFTPLGLHANELGRMYAVAYGLLLFAWAESRDSRLSAPLFASMCALVVALVLTFSRGAFLGFILVNALFVLWRGSAKTLMVAILAAIAFLVALPGAVLVRVQLGLGGFDINAITAGRWDHIWMPLLPELFRSPIWGSGLGSIMWTPPMRAGQMFLVEHPHNAYIQALTDMGLAGLILVCAFWVRTWKGFRALSADVSLAPELRGLFQGAAASVIAIAVANIAGSSLLPVTDQCLLWMAVGLMYGVRQRQARD